MRKIIAGLFVCSFVVLMDGCASGPPKPVLPNGSNRVPINATPPLPASVACPALPAPSAAGGRP